MCGRPLEQDAELREFESWFAKRKSKARPSNGEPIREPGSNEGEAEREPGEDESERKSDAAPDNLWPPSLDVEALAEREPQPPAFIVPGWVPCGYATLFAGHGGVGKSGIALHLAVCMAAGVPFFSLEVEQRRVTYLSCEDRENILHWRLARICAYTGISLASLRGKLEVIDLVGRDCILWERDPQTGLTVTRAYLELKARVQEYGSQVLMLDGVTDTFAGSEFETRRETLRERPACFGPARPWFRLARGSHLQAHRDRHHEHARLLRHHGMA